MQPPDCAAARRSLVQLLSGCRSVIYYNDAVLSVPVIVLLFMSGSIMVDIYIRGGRWLETWVVVDRWTNNINDILEMTRLVDRPRI